MKLQMFYSFTNVYTNECIANVWACEVRNETHVSKNVLYEKDKN